MKIKDILLTMFIAVFSFLSCDADNSNVGIVNTEAVNVKIVNTENTEFELVWEENFNTSTLDSNVWNIEIVPNPYNNEYQYYREENVSIEIEPISGNQCLVLTARKEDFGGRSFTSGRVNTLEKVAFKYGRIDARVKVPRTANGLWPAFWMKGNDNATVGWPMCGEIDIMEMGHVNGINSNTQDKYLGSACHWGPTYAEYKSHGKKNTFDFTLQRDDFHLYTLIWDENYVKMYLDLDRSQIIYIEINIVKK